MKPEKRANKMAKYMCNENLWLKKCFFSWKFYPPNHYHCFCCFPIYLPWSDGTGNNDRLYFLGLQNYCRWWLQAMKLKDASPWKKSYDQPRQHIKNQRHYFANKGPSSQSSGFSTHKDWARTVSECLLWRYGSAVACHRGSECNRPRYGISPLGGGCY